MCGIVAYIGEKEAFPIIINGLKRLEYRGYDSAGIALFNKGIEVYKCKGKVSDLVAHTAQSDISGTLGVGHTRWATHGGDFLLRIEDTDSNRFVPGAEAYIVEALKWCGIEIDEGVSVGGPHEPYRQSERRAIYKKYADQLVASGNAYYAFDTPEELDALRLRYETEGKTFTYNYEIRNTLSTSIVLSAEEVKRRIDAGDGWVIRFKMPVNEEVEMFDLIRDRVVVNTSTLDDKVLFKSADMLPTYHLANVVDDYLMEISHVIRGEEWLPSLPLHATLCSLVKIFAKAELKQ